MSNKTKDFPKNFFWGSATSAHQVEGGNYNNDWWEWEQKHKDLESSGKACNHYNLFCEDFDLAKNLNHNAHRLSLEWSRIEPKEGEFNQKEINHYIRVLKALKERGFWVILTLHHFTIPLWFSHKGGFLNSQSDHYFTKFTELACKKFSDYVDLWITINEPNVLAVHGFFKGDWPPGKTSFLAYKKVMKNLAKCHKEAYKKIHALLPEAKVGIAKNFIYFAPFKSLRDKIACRIAKKFWNENFYKKTKGYHDFIGVNYYFREFIQAKLKPPFYKRKRGGEIFSDLGWEIYSQGLYRILLPLKKYNLPIYITENGVADKEDKLRGDFIINHIKVMGQAVSEGVDLRGYFHWSLMDNFEWAYGFTPRFGLIEVDYKTQERIPRNSAYVYADIIKKNS